jgi:hypothetical protein
MDPSCFIGMSAASFVRDIHPAHERETIRETERPKPPAASFGSIIPDYFAARSKLRESSMEETKRYLEQHWKALHPKSPAEITRYDVAVELTRREGEGTGIGQPCPVITQQVFQMGGR